MAGPYRGVNLVLKVTINSIEYTLGCVEGTDIDFGYEGGPEACYGRRTKSHSAGSKRISFTITRWWYTDEGQEDLLLDLMNSETEFTLEGSLIDKNGDPIANTEIILLDCRLYGWKPRTGGADDLLGEEARGNALDWDFTEVEPTSP